MSYEIPGTSRTLRLRQLADVSSADPAAKQPIVWDATKGRWSPSSLLGPLTVDTLEVLGVSTFRGNMQLLTDKRLELVSSATGSPFLRLEALSSRFQIDLDAGTSANTLPFSLRTKGVERIYVSADGNIDLSTRLHAGKASGYIDAGAADDARLRSLGDDVDPTKSGIVCTYGGTGNAPRFRTQRARTSLAAPSVVQAGDDLGAMTFQGWDGDQFINAGVVRTYAQSGIANNIVPGKLSLGVANAAGTLVEPLSLYPASLNMTPDGGAQGGITVSGSSSRSVSTYVNLGSGSFNGIVAANDLGLISAGSAIDTAPGLVISPWMTGTGGIRIDGSGRVGLATAGTLAAQVEATTQNAARIALQVWGASGQSTDIFRVSTNGSGSVFSVGSDGKLKLGSVMVGNSGAAATAYGAAPASGDRRVLIYNESGTLIGYMPLFA